MATNVKELQQYFADMDAAEEADAAAAGLTPDELRRSRLEPEYVKENRRASRVATEEAARTGEAPKDVLYDTDRMAALEKAGTQRVPPSMATPLEFARPINTKGSAVGLEQTGRLLRSRLDLPETVPSLSMPSGVPAKTTDFASLQKLMSPGALKAPEAQPIPVASVPTKTSDIATAIPTASSVGTKAIPPTTSTSSAPPAGTSSTVKPPPGMDGSGGDDELSSLRTRLGLQQAFEGLGSAASGKNLRTDGGVLVDRMKQIEALRAKREERAMELAREDEQSSALVSQYKSLAAQGLVPELPALDRLPPKQAASLIKTYGSLPGLVQKTEKTKAEIPLVQAKTATEQGKPEIAKGGLEVKRGTLAERERSNKANEDIRRQALLLKKASDTKANNDVRAAGSDPKQAEKAITDAMKSAEKKDLGIASNIRDFQGLEAVAPGFTKGIVPSWLGQGSIAAAIKVPGLNKQATQLASALELFTAGIRNSLFGASLTGNEKESFDAIVSSGVLMPPDVLAANINRLREGAARFAQNHFTVAQELHPEVTGRVLRASPLFGPATREGGVYSDVWLLPAGASPVSGAGPAAPAPAAQVGGMVKVRHKASGKTATVDRAKADEMLKRPDFEEVK